MKKPRPVLGLLPKEIWLDLIFDELKKAIARYTNANIEIPKEWTDEYINFVKLIINKR